MLPSLTHLLLQTLTSNSHTPTYILWQICLSFFSHCSTTNIWNCDCHSKDSDGPKDSENGLDIHQVKTWSLDSKLFIIYSSSFLIYCYLHKEAKRNWSNNKSHPQRNQSIYPVLITYIMVLPKQRLMGMLKVIKPRYKQWRTKARRYMGLSLKRGEATSLW